MSPEVQNGGISICTKRTCVLQNLFRNKKKNSHPPLSKNMEVSIRVFHKHTKLAMLALLQICFNIKLQFSSLFAPSDVSKWDTKIKG